jgi:hypothetical protein
MPMTCAGGKMSLDAVAAQKIVNVLEKVTHVLNKEWVAGVVEESIAGLEAEFFAGGGNAQVAKLRGLLKDATHAELVAIFYLLLNIDVRLKTRMLQMDSGNAKRIGRFVLDLRQELVVDFFCSPQTTAEFVQACGDGYKIA